MPRPRSTTASTRKPKSAVRNGPQPDPEQPDAPDAADAPLAQPTVASPDAPEQPADADPARAATNAVAGPDAPGSAPLTGPEAGEQTAPVTGDVDDSEPAGEPIANASSVSEPGAAGLAAPVGAVMEPPLRPAMPLPGDAYQDRSPGAVHLSHLDVGVTIAENRPSARIWDRETGETPHPDDVFVKDPPHGSVYVCRKRLMLTTVSETGQKSTQLLYPAGFTLGLVEVQRMRVQLLAQRPEQPAEG